MTSRADIASGKGLTSRVKRDELSEETTTIVLPNLRKMCAIFLFFVGSFAVGFGAGFGTGFASKICESI